MLEAFEDIEITYQDSGISHLQELFTFLNFTEGQRAVTYLMWGKSRDWHDWAAYLDWREDLFRCRMATDLWAWFNYEGISAAVAADAETEKELSKHGGTRSSEPADRHLSRRVSELTWPEVSRCGFSFHEFLSMRKPGASLALLHRLSCRCC